MIIDAIATIKILHKIVELSLPDYIIYILAGPRTTQGADPGFFQGGLGVV